MSDKVCLIKQPAGLGDIFFCQKIVKVFQDETEYKRVIWPVVPEYAYIKDYLIGDIEYVSQDEDFDYKDDYYNKRSFLVEKDEILYIPLQTADSFIGQCSCHNDTIAHGHMKYNFVGIDYSDWKDYFEFNRNEDRENNLIERIGLDINQPYNVINNNYGTYPNYLTRDDIVTTNSYKNVYMDFYEGVNIFDWIKILENAKEIHTVETSLYYILEKLGLENVFIYSKNNNRWNDFTYMRNHCSPNWKYIR